MVFLFIFTNVIAFLLFVWKLYVWCSLFTIGQSGSGAVIRNAFRVALFFLESWTTMTFWLLVCGCGYWFIFFKLQEAVHILLFTLDSALYPENLRRFDIVFGIMAGFKLVCMAIKIWFQCETDYFIMDRERKIDLAAKNTPNAWRHIFVVNELNEMQMQTYVSVELTIMCYVWFMQAEGFENWCNYDPNLSLEPTKSPNSYILKYFMGTIMLFIIGYVQYIV